MSCGFVLIREMSFLRCRSPTYHTESRRNTSITKTAQDVSASSQQLSTYSRHDSRPPPAKTAKNSLRVHVYRFGGNRGSAEHPREVVPLTAFGDVAHAFHFIYRSASTSRTYIIDSKFADPTFEAFSPLVQFGTHLRCICRSLNF